MWKMVSLVWEKLNLRCFRDRQVWMTRRQPLSFLREVKVKALGFGFLNFFLWLLIISKLKLFLVLSELVNFSNYFELILAILS